MAVFLRPTCFLEGLKSYGNAYDHAGRLLRTYHQINDGPEVLLAENKYNELGELIEKNLHSEDDGATFHQSIDYRYNIRGWLTRINDAALSEGDGDYFGMELGYNEALAGVDATAAYNGNISAVKWSDNLGTAQRAYAYAYDPMNRLVQADHSIIGQGNTTAFDVHIGSLVNPGYDLNGNIESLTRNGQNAGAAAVIDQLSYAYEGNKLLSVSDNSANLSGFRDGNSSGDDYTYDANGNLLSDKNKRIDTLEYNYLNLVRKVIYDTGDSTVYVYDANGNKLSQIDYLAGNESWKQEYLGDFIYNNGQLQTIVHDEGAIVVNRDDLGEVYDYEYRYDIKDHLGNTRLTFTSADVSFEYSATMETDDEDIRNEEEALFVNVDETRETFSPANHTPGGNEVAMLNSNQPIGPSSVLTVHPGDVIDIDTWVYHEMSSGYNGSINAASAVALIAGAFGGVSGAAGESGQLYTGFEDGIGLFGPASSSDDDIPAAYLNYILFDENDVPVDGGFVQASGASYLAHEQLAFDPITIQQTGYLYIYVSNESNSLNPVYFDDLRIHVTKLPIIKREDYYPMGMSIKETAFHRDNDLYTGQHTPYGLGLIDLGFRQYDPVLGRFYSIDPLAELQLTETPYQYAGNNPVTNIDPYGLLSLNFIKNFVNRVRAALSGGTVSQRFVNGKKTLVFQKKGKNDKPKGGNSTKKPQNSQQQTASSTTGSGSNTNTTDNTAGSTASNKKNESDSNSDSDQRNDQNSTFAPLRERLKEENVITNRPDNRPPRFNSSTFTSTSEKEDKNKPNQNPTLLSTLRESFEQDYKDQSNKLDKYKADLVSKVPYNQALSLRTLAGKKPGDTRFYNDGTSLASMDALIEELFDEIQNDPPFSTNGAIDMSKAPAGEVNELGWPRNKKYFWENYEDPFNGLSDENKQLLADNPNATPVVDEQWRQNVPGEADAILGEPIEHHHVNKGRYAIPRAQSLHRRGTWFKKLHPKFKSSAVFKKGSGIFGRTGKTMVGRFNVLYNFYDALKTTFTTDPESIGNQIMDYNDGGIITEPFNGFEAGRLYYIPDEDAYFEVEQITRDTNGNVTFLEWTIYDNYGYDTHEGKYIGIGVINEGVIGSS